MPFMMRRSCEKSDTIQKVMRMNDVVRLEGSGAGRRVAAPDPAAEEASHYLRLDLARRFLDMVWAEGVAAGRAEARLALRETRRAFPMAAASDALAAFDRNLESEGAPPPPEIFAEALRGLMASEDGGDPRPRRA
jgi:hypothetical protein